MHLKKKVANDSLKLVKGKDRQHFYHVICYDLMVETMRKNKKTTKMKGADRAEFCLVCQQEGYLKKEEKKRKEEE